MKDYKIYIYDNFHEKLYPGLDEMIASVEKNKYSDFYGHFPEDRLKELPKHFVIAVKEKDEVIGFTRGAIMWNWIDLRTLWVSREKRRSGVGSKLISELLELINANTLGGIYLTTWNPEAVSFYLKNGFQVTHQINDHPPGHTCNFMKLVFNNV